MDQPSFEDPIWCQAITLTERVASLRRVQRKSPDFKGNAELANRRVQRWRSQPPFGTGSYFSQRLAMDGMSEDKFLYLLGEPVEAVCDRFPVPPTWLKELAQAFSHPPSPKPIPLLETLCSQGMAGFLSVIEPLISHGRDHLHQGVQALIQTQADLPFDPETGEDILFANLPRRLMQMLSRTMALELNVARLQGILEGDTPEARFHNFVQRLRRRDTALAILQEYPVLARQLVTCIDHWAAFSLEFLQHLCADWQAIRTMFSPENDPGMLVQVERVSYECRGGRSVQIVGFTSGLKVVYKPRSLALDMHFQELLAWINDRGDHPPFRTLKILNRPTHGWAEFIDAQSCMSLEEVQRFYERQGSYLALLYVLEATDFHFENLIAAGEHPLLIDVEALFHPRVGGVELKQVDQLASNGLNDSVLKVGLLPQHILANAESDGIDISGLGAVAGQLTPFGVPHWEGSGTDEMCSVRKRAVMSDGQNRPSLNGTEVDVRDYADAIAAGFTKIYRLLLKHRGDLLADDGPIARFTEDEVRAFPRPTQGYGLLLRDSFHPDVLRDALERDRLFDWLWAAVEHLPYLAKVIPAEREDLQQGDIPRFSTRPRSRDLWSSSNERITDFFEESGMVLVQHRMQRLSEHDLEQQLRFIRASLTSLTIGEDSTRHSTYRLTKPQSKVDRKRLLAAARKVAERLEVLTLRCK